MRAFKPQRRRKEELYITDDVGNLFVVVFYSPKEGFVYPIGDKVIPKDIKKRINKYKNE